MKPNLQTIALALSGGGYRAAAFHLGVLSYLHRLEDAEGEKYLSKVKLLSTISGGSITGMTHLYAIAKGESFEDYFKKLYTWLKKDDLLDSAMTKINGGTWDNTEKTKNLINAFAELYQSELFDGNSLGFLSEKISDISFSFNATDMNNAMPFRFQNGTGVTGSGTIKIAPDLKPHIRLGDILAASSCFPVGFEPLYYPNDFFNQPLLTEITKEARLLNEPLKKHTGVMDGGILDNQGISNLLNLIGREQTDKDQIDLIIYSDVHKGTRINDNWQTYHKNKLWLTLDFAKTLLNTMGVIALIFILYSLYEVCNNTFDFCNFICLLVGAVVLTLTITTRIIYNIIRKKIINKIDKIAVNYRQNFIEKFKIIEKIPISQLISLVKIRLKSAHRILDSIMLKNQRDLIQTYSLFRDKSINDKVCSIMIERKVRNEEAITKEKNLSTILDSAAEMPTTLWFVKDDHDQNRLDNLIISGQYHTCIKLLTTYEKWKESENTNPTFDTQHLDNIIATLQKDKAQFEKKPAFMLVP